MSSNLKSARQAIEAELSHARQGATYYAARVEALEVALHQLKNVEGDGKAVSREEKPRASAKKPKVNGARRGRKSRGVAGANGAQGLPSTGGDFWFSLVSEQPQSAVDISNAAISVLGIKPDQKEQIQKLKQRVSPALAGLVAAQKIRDSGAGRERRFFKE